MLKRHNLNSAFSLEGKRALVTGATAGIGLAVAKRLVDHGAKVVINGRRDDGDQIAKEIDAQFLKADIARDDDIKTLFDETERLLGGLDIVVNNAGISIPASPIASQSIDDFDRLFGINVRAAFLVLQEAARRVSPGGSIINTASIAGLEGSAHGAVYNASKASIISLTKSSALELAGRNIRVNSVSPGLIHSEIWKGRPPEQSARFRAPLGRIGEADEAAAVYHFLAADESRYVTGANYLVDGGYSAGATLRLREALQASAIENPVEDSLCQS